MENNDSNWHEFLLWDIQNEIDQAKGTVGLDTGKLSDGHHTFEELYNFRKMYNAVLFNEWAEDKGWKHDVELIEDGKVIVVSEGYLVGKYEVHKSKRHHDGSSSEGWFIVCAMLPSGLISNHYKMEDWNLFQIPETEKALFEYDGHTGEDTLKRLAVLCR